MSQAPLRGQFLWHELMTTDPPAALLFYPRVIGWSVRDSAQDPSYRLLTSDGAPRAGVMRLPEEASASGMPPSWMSYIGTPDVDATTQQAESLGATVLRAPTDVPGLCRFAILRDPQGAVFGAYAAQHPIGPLGNTPVGGFSWHELATADGSAAWDFYAALFGWRKTDAMEMGPIGKYQMFGVNEQSLGGIYTLPRDLDIASHWLPYTQVEDSRRAGAAVEAGGGRVVSAPMQVPSGAWVAKLVDPQGVVFAVHSRQVSPVAEAAAPASGKSPTSRSTKPAPKRVTTRSVPRAHSKPAAKKAGGARSSARKSAKAPRAKRAASTRSRATTRARAAGAAKPARRPAAKAAAKKRKRA